MSQRIKWMNIVMALALMSLVAGCRTHKKANALNPTDVPGDEPLTTIDDIGERITGVSFEAVLFDYNGAQIRTEETSKIEAVSDYLKDNSNYRVLVEGNCDERGTAEYNMALGERRALAVRAYLIGLEINADRVITRSLGEEKPVDPGHDESAWSLNRRAEFGIYK